MYLKVKISELKMKIFRGEKKKNGNLSTKDVLVKIVTMFLINNVTVLYNK